MTLSNEDLLFIEKMFNKRGKLVESAIGTLTASLAGKQVSGNYASLVGGYIPTSQLGSGTPGAGKYVDGASGVWTGLPAAAPHDILSASHSDTTAAAVQIGDLMYGDTTPKWKRLAIGVALQVLAVPSGPNPVPTWHGLTTADVTGVEATANKNAANGYAGLSSGKIAASQMTAVLASSDLTNDSALEKTANKNAASGYAGLDSTSRIAQAQAPIITQENKSPAVDVTIVAGYSSVILEELTIADGKEFLIDDGAEVLIL